MGETSIPCQAETRNRLRDDKTAGVSWDRYLNDLLDAAERADGYESGAEVNDLDSLASSIEAIEARTGRIERTLEDMGAKR
jgi:hypothetical protein